ncbi:MAG TPA: DUF2268 domain-containing putative Zn-dependent protease [Candidatus Binatia bacterium]
MKRYRGEFLRVDMSIKKIIPTVLCFVLCALTTFAQTSEPQVNRDPNQAKFVTSDIDNFWRAFDLATKETDREKKIAIFQTHYLDKGSAGLRDFVRLRIKSAKGLVETIEKLPTFYASARPSTLRIADMEKKMRRSFRRFKQIYPDAAFPDVYFVIGVANTGGTASGSGLLIGAELYGLTPKTPRDEFPAWFKTFLPDVQDEKELLRLVTKALDTALKPVEKLPSIVAHESCHFNQHYPKQTTLLEKSIQEGACDLIAELTAGEVINPALKVYGDRHEADLWREFQAEMNGTDLSKWMYNGFKIKDRPGDLGYYMGYKISKAYYQNAKDKRQAIRDVLNIKDFPDFLDRSRYGEKFAESGKKRVLEKAKPNNGMQRTRN